MTTFNLLKTFNLPGWLTTNQVAERMGVSTRYVRLLVGLRYLPQGVRINDSPFVLYSEADINQYIASHPRLGHGRKQKVAESA